MLRVGRSKREEEGHLYIGRKGVGGEVIGRWEGERRRERRSGRKVCT